MFYHTQMSAIKWFYLISLMLLFCWSSLIECKRQQAHANDADHELRSSEDEGGGGGGGAGSNLGNGHQQAHRKKHRQHENKLSLWINEQQLNMLSGNVLLRGHLRHAPQAQYGRDSPKRVFVSLKKTDLIFKIKALFFPQGFGSHGRIYAIENGHVFNLPEINVYKFLIIPAEVNYVNFTWKSGSRKYFYHFDRLISLDHNVLKDPKLSIAKKGRIPAEEKDFSIFMPCVHNNSGTAMFTIGLSIQNRREKLLPGTPIRLNFKKECAHRGNASISTLTSSQGPDPECNLKCGDNGFCNHNKICQCKAGYTGQYCQTAFCFPQCLNGGNCTAPSVCTCPDGYQGTYCEGGICSEKCLNGGKCIQKDKCQCSKGYYGLHCEFSKCVIPCKNGGRCIGPNICRCPSGLLGNHCEIERIQRSTCRRPCKHGVCTANKTCKCDRGFYGRHCNARIKKHRKIHR